MNTILSLMSGGWGWLAGIGAVVVALLGTYFGGKKIGATQAKADAQVTAAKVESAQVSAVAEKQKENTEVAKNAQSSNASLSDSAARDKLRKSGFNRPE